MPSNWAIQILVESPKSSEIFQKHMPTLLLETHPVSQTCSSSRRSCRPIPVGSWVHGRHEWGRLRPDWSWRPKTLPSILTRYLWSVLCRHMGQHTILTLPWGAHVFGSWSSSGDRPGTSWERKLDPARPGVCPLPRQRRFYFTFMLLGVEKWGCRRQFLYQFR